MHIIAYQKTSAQKCTTRKIFFDLFVGLCYTLAEISFNGLLKWGGFMLYTAQTRQAMLLAYSAHHGQLDRSGVPYIFHPLHLAEQMHTENEIVAALLHDVVEDTTVTLADLQKAGFAPEIIEAVRLLTHDKSTPYMDYINALKENPIARAVKLADLKHNSDLTRLKDHSEKTRERLKKYAEALRILE